MEGMILEVWLLIAATLLYLFRRPLIRNWRLSVPLLLSPFGGLLVVGLLGSAGPLMPPREVVLGAFAFGTAMTFALISRLFR